jgi:hypothetical protein
MIRDNISIETQRHRETYRASIYINMRDRETERQRHRDTERHEKAEGNTCFDLCQFR